LGFLKGGGDIAAYLINKLIEEKGFDPTTSTNFCPVGEAQMALLLQKKINMI
jgi:hypothetical protein